MPNISQCHQTSRDQGRLHCKRTYWYERTLPIHGSIAVWHLTVFCCLRRSSICDTSVPNWWCKPCLSCFHVMLLHIATFDTFVCLSGSTVSFPCQGPSKKRAHQLQEVFSIPNKFVGILHGWNVESQRQTERNTICTRPFLRETRDSVKLCLHIFTIKSSPTALQNLRDDQANRKASAKGRREEQ